MRLLRLEIKRVLKSRRTYILVALSLFLSIIMAYMPVSFVETSYLDENKNRVELKGIEAIRYIKTLQSDTTGSVTPEKVRLAVEVCQSCFKEYGVTDYYELPEDIYNERILPFEPLLHGIKEVFADRHTGMAASIMAIRPEQIDVYYDACNERLISLMKMEQIDAQAPQDKAIAMYQKVEKPYRVYPGYNSDAMDYELLLAVLLLIFCAIISAPIFSSDYQTGADDILRCTKHGRARLGTIKMISVLGISSVLFIVCMGIYLMLSNSLFGWECIKTSMQMEYSITNLANWNMGQLQFAVVLTGLLSVIATMSFILFLSSKSRNVITSLSIGLLMCIAPILVYMIIPGEIGLWLRCMLPSGALGMTSSFLYATFNFEFLGGGNIAIWTPYAMIGFEIIEVLVFTILAIRAYVHHKVG
ncbi:MAG: ABC transporter permease [Cellulosilyticum sp.]|nr:ABC transporter permease [Cellulosilyticum sp.]